MQQVDELNHLAGQTVICSYVIWVFFMPIILRYWRLPIRKLRLAFRGEVHQLVAAYMVTAFFCIKSPIINLNATSYGKFI